MKSVKPVKYMIFMGCVAGFLFLSQYIDDHITFPFEDLIKRIHIIGHRSLSPVFVYLVLLFLVYISFRKIIKRVFVLTHKPCKKVISDKALSSDLVRKMAIGGIFAEQHLMTSNTLNTGSPGFIIKKKLKDAWKVHDRETALKAIQGLKDLKQTKRFDLVHELSENKPPSEWDQLVSQQCTDVVEREQITESLTHFTDMKVNLKRVFGYGETDFTQGITAWDMGRLIGISRMCLDCGYISREEALENIELAYNITSKRHKSWEEIKKAYLLGRVFWKGDIYSLNSMDLYVKRMDTAELSPWREYSFI